MTRRTDTRLPPASMRTVWRSFFTVALAIATLFAVDAFSQDSSAILVKKKADSGQRKPVTFRVAMREGMRFDPARLSAHPGDEIVIDLENADTTQQIHNFVLVQPGKLDEVVRASMSITADGLERHFVPESPAVMVHSVLLEPEKSQRIRFTLPNQPGIYPYVCTFPGHAMVMYGALYSGVPMPPIDQDKNLPSMIAQTLVCGGGRRPFVQRMFMPNAGPAAIAVALPGDQNFCWDAGQCRLRYVWKGGFIDASEHWRGNGSILAKLPVSPWWTAPDAEFPMRFGSVEATPSTVTFLGYHLSKDGPEFRYRIDGVGVTEKITASSQNRTLEIRVRVPGAKKPVFMHLGPSSAVKWSASTGDISEGYLRLTPQQAADFTLTLTAPHGQ